MKSKNPFSRVVAAIALAIGSFHSIRAASATGETAQPAGVITGQVSNAATGANLEGARVTLEADGRSVLTTRGGAFVLEQVPAGSQQVKVTYAGLDAATVPVHVGPGATVRTDVELTADIYRLAKMVVVGEREGNALAITEQRNALNVKNVISADSFGDISSFNLGNLLLRVPGVAYKQQEGETTQVHIRGVAPDLNSVTIDGTRAANGSTRTYTRGFVIDTAPADFIGLIEVTKAPRPDMDADSIGGAVNLRAKTAFDVQGRRISYQLGGSYSVRTKTLYPQVSFGYSNQFKDKKIGVVITGSYSKTDRPWETSIINYEQTLDTNRPVWFYPLVFGNSLKGTERTGLNVRVDYKPTNTTRLYVSAIGSQYTDFLERRWGRVSAPTSPTLAFGPNIVSVTDNVTVTRNQTFSYQQETRDRDLNTLTLKLGADTTVGGGKLDIDASLSPSRGTEQRWRYINTNVAGVGFSFDRSATGQYEYLDLTQVSGPDILDPRNRTLNSVSMPDDIKSSDRIIGSQLNWRKPLHAGVPIELKAGLRYRSQRRSLDNNFRVYDYVGPNGVIGPPGAANDDNLARFIDPADWPVSYRYPKELKFLQFEPLKAELKTNPAFFKENFAVGVRDSLRLDSTIDEEVGAAYVQSEFTFGRLQVLTGVRMEDTRTQARGNKDQITRAEAARRAAYVGPLTDDETIRRTIAQYGNRSEFDGQSYTNYFPGLHFVYRLSSGLVARASYSTGIGRPQFTNLAPTAVIDEERQTVVGNNPELRPQRSKSIDLTLEYYYEPAGSISVAVFQKKLKDFIFRQGGAVLERDNVFGEAYAGYLLTTDYNGGKATIKGAEVSYQQRFSRLSGFLRGFGVFANFTWLESKGDYGTPGAALTASELPDFTPRTGNAGISYIDRGWTIRAKINHTSDRLNNFNANPALRIYQIGSNPVDLDVAYAVNRRLSIFVNAVNLFNTPITNTYQYVPAHKNINQIFSTLINFGVKGSF